MEGPRRENGNQKGSGLGRMDVETTEKTNGIEARGESMGQDRNLV